ncbi:MAG: hypothetical protein JRI54_00335 [Deltaproteobacteria bacterium]|nr:hypothetical protein [Deltaproteobacteria bacterium]
MYKTTKTIGDEKMSYTSKSNLNSPLHQREREMLLAGFSYAEIAQALGVRQKSVSERNRLVYRINLQDAFARRIERDGIPNRLNVSDSFGYWFSGFVDGEGNFEIFSRRRRTGKYVERRAWLQIIIRDDDTDTIQFIYDNLKCGIIYHNKGHGRTNPNVTFRVEKIKGLAEIIVPLFEKYPLHTKKASEFIIWRNVVKTQYILTLGGYSQRVAATDEQNAAFNQALQAITKIRHYTPTRK